MSFIGGAGSDDDDRGSGGGGGGSGGSGCDDDDRGSDDDDDGDGDGDDDDDDDDGYDDDDRHKKPQDEPKIVTKVPKGHRNRLECWLDPDDDGYDAIRMIFRRTNCLGSTRRYHFFWQIFLMKKQKSTTFKNMFCFRYI